MYIHSPNSKTVFHTVFPSLLQNENRLLWKLGTLPPGLLTFYKLTHPLDKSWHVLGLGYNPTIERSEIDNAAVIHYNGNMKPWLEIAMTKYRPYWTKYINYEHSYIHGCKISQQTPAEVFFHDEHWSQMGLQMKSPVSSITQRHVLYLCYQICQTSSVCSSITHLWCFVPQSIVGSCFTLLLLSWKENNVICDSQFLIS